MSLSPERKGRFTASNHAIALGHGYQSPQAFWRKWNGMEEHSDYVTSVLLTPGKDNEEAALISYEEITGDIVTHCLERQEFIKWEEWSGCTPDGRTQRGLVDFKVPAKGMYEEPPTCHWIQLQSQMFFTETGIADLVAWSPEETRIWRTKKDETYWPAVEPRLKKYWECLTRGMEPKRGQFKKIALPFQWERIA